MQTALGTAVILTLSALLVIVPGLYLNAVLRAQGIVDGLVAWIESLQVRAEPKALILLLGFLPAVESLTGFGVSLFLGVPIFFRLFPADKAYRLSLLGMNIMPWGTLALATVIGASLSGYPTVVLGTATALTSSAVFPCIGLIALYTLGGGEMLRRHGALALALGAGLSASLFLFNRIGLTETAGILAGAMTGLGGFLLLRGRGIPARATDPDRAGEHAPARVARLLLPYILVLALILLTRTIGPIHRWLTDLLLLTTERVKFSVFTSPGLALAVVAFFLIRLQPVRIDHKAIWTRARVATLGLFCFILLAQIMRESNMIAAVATLLEQQGSGQASVMSLLSPLLGMVSGFITGSNLGGNALIMTVQQQIGSALGEGLLFSAVQNSAAGHAVFASLPIIILVMTIARDGSEQEKTAEHDLLRFTLKVAAFVLAAVVLACVVVRHAGLLALVVPGAVR
ncbi:L-lactate permease [Sorangium cellulosum]|uniref:L-lactate permease n=1 Tax=Sorangium cellulosum TaxID=56 RepID=UPI0030B84141